MISSETLAVVYGLSSAAAWGAGDFTGGLATKKSRVHGVIFFSQIIGLLLLVAMALGLNEAIPDGGSLFYGGCAGICGVLGLMALYRGLATGSMGIVAPLSAVVTALLPICFSFFNEGLPKPIQLAGFGVALLAVWLLSHDGTSAGFKFGELHLPLVAGVGFGLFFIFIDKSSTSAVYWPLVSARCTAILLTGILLAFTGGNRLPKGPSLPLILLTGLLDAGGNAFFALATRIGRLDISAVLSSLYPAATVLLAWAILKEKIHQRQWVGVICAMTALAMIAN